MASSPATNQIDLFLSDRRAIKFRFSGWGDEDQKEGHLSKATRKDVDRILPALKLDVTLSVDVAKSSIRDEFLSRNVARWSLDPPPPTPKVESFVRLFCMS
jgi:hypothetical protein